MGKSRHVVRDFKARNQDAKIDPLLEAHFGGGRLYAATSGWSEQVGRADAYILEGKESWRYVLLQLTYIPHSSSDGYPPLFYMRKLRADERSRLPVCGKPKSTSIVDQPCDIREHFAPRSRLSASFVYMLPPNRAFYLQLLCCFIWLLCNYHLIILSEGCHDLVGVTQFAEAVKRGIELC